MRILLMALVLSLCLAAPAPVAATSELRGVARVGTRVLADAVIRLEAPPSSTPESIEPEPLWIERNLQFLPHVLAVRVGATVRFPNSDCVFHNVFSFHDGRKFDLGAYPIRRRQVREVRSARCEPAVLQHPPRDGRLCRLGHSPYFGTTDYTGAYVIHAPPGRYAYHAWRAGGARS